MSIPPLPGEPDCAAADDSASHPAQLTALLAPAGTKLPQEHAPAGSEIFVGVIDPINPGVESPEEVKDRVLEAAEFISADRLGTCDDCGFSPFGDDTSTARETAFAKVQARVEGTRMAEQELGLA